MQPLTTWPGRAVDAWLITDVTVSPDARRRGVLRAMMLRSSRTPATPACARPP